MATVKTFEELKAWQLAREVAKEIYVLTLTGSFSKDFELKDQIRKSSGSVMDNIAEGLNAGVTGSLYNFYPLQRDLPAKRDPNFIVLWIENI